MVMQVCENRLTQKFFLLPVRFIHIEGRMFLETQDFDFAQILSNLTNYHFCPNFTSILPKSNQF